MINIQYKAIGKQVNHIPIQQQMLNVMKFRLFFFQLKSDFREKVIAYLF